MAKLLDMTVGELSAILNTSHYLLLQRVESEVIKGCTRGRNVERGTKGFRIRKTGLSRTLVKLRYDQ